MVLFKLGVDWAPKLAKWAGKLRDQKRAKDKAVTDELNRINDRFTDPVALAGHYIEPDFQQFNPADRLEDTGHAVREPVFKSLDEWLPEHREHNKRLFVLADAGMGKTSLLVMLKLLHMAGKWGDPELRVVLLKLGPNTLETLKAIKDARNTVLLLDSLDEDPTVRGRVKARLVELLDATGRFHRVILTCRTQFFSAGESPFNNRGRVAVGDHTVEVLYLSLFSDAQVDAYLGRRFPKGWRDALLFREHPKVTGDGSSAQPEDDA